MKMVHLATLVKVIFSIRLCLPLSLRHNLFFLFPPRSAMLSVLPPTSPYSLRASQLSSVLRDHLAHPLERAAYHVEYVMRHAGARHLRLCALCAVQDVPNKTKLTTTLQICPIIISTCGHVCTYAHLAGTKIMTISFFGNTL